MLAGQSQAVIDSLVDDWLPRCLLVDNPGEVRIDLGVLAGQPNCLIRELLVALWRRKGWPLQAMGLRKWDELTTLTAMPEGKQVFPAA